MANTNKDTLLEQFEALLGRPAPAYIRRRLLELAVGYALQEAAAGGRDEALARQLRRLDTRFSETGEAGLRQQRTLKPGTRLLREWQGQTHVVTVTQSGFLHKSDHYRSLSAVARHITGTYWSGPKFFGLRDSG
jgi:hypothetical protein